MRFPVTFCELSPRFSGNYSSETDEASWTNKFIRFAPHPRTSLSSFAKKDSG